MLEPTITNLRVLSKIQSQDKISVKENLFYISPPLWTRPIRRSFTQNDRFSSLEAIKSTITSAIELTNTLMNSVNYSNDTPVSDMQKQKDHCSLKNLFEVMGLSLVGLENLRNSYSDDQSYVASIEGLIITLKDQNEIVREFITSDS